jgi:hypothetical protein
MTPMHETATYTTLTRLFLIVVCTYTFRSIFPIIYGSSSEKRRVDGWSRPAVLCAVIAASACGVCVCVCVCVYVHDICCA